MRVLFSPHPHLHMLFVVFLIITILTCVKCYLTMRNDLHFLDDLMLTIFHMYYGHLYVFFEKKMSIKIHCLFFNQAVFSSYVEFMSFYVFCNINPLSDMSLANIFFHSVGCFFILLIVCFMVQKFFSLM